MRFAGLRTPPAGPQVKMSAIADQGGVPSLIALLSHARSEVHRDSAGALWSLAPNVDNQKLIAKCNGITPLVTLLLGLCAAYGVYSLRVAA